MVGMHIGVSRRLGVPVNKVWVDLLRQAVLDSFNCGYHREDPYCRNRREYPFMDWERALPIGVMDDKWV